MLTGLVVTVGSTGPRPWCDRAANWCSRALLLALSIVADCTGLTRLIASVAVSPLAMEQAAAIISVQTALARLTAEKARIDRNISALETALGTLGGGSGRRGQRRRRRLSAAARRAIGRRMKAYWAKRREKRAKKAG